MASGNPGSTCSEATVEIKIKTLDSQTYTLRVDKCVPVPELKERIATVTGVLSEQQRLICRGRVLKDDQLLSAYHVEDGHTLHMVVRQPFQPFSVSDSSPNNNIATDHLLGDFYSQGIQAGSSLVVEAFNISGQGDGVFPSFNEIVSAFLSSFGAESGSEGVNLREPSNNGLGDSSGQQLQSTSQPPVIHDSLTTLSQFLNNLRHEFGVHVSGGDGNNSNSAATHGSNVQSSERVPPSTAEQAGLAGPASLAEVLLSTRQLLIQQVASSLSQQAQQLEDQANLTDQSARATLQRSSLRSGALLQNLGALLLELGRATMTLRLGETPADAVVNAGPPVFISSLGPNPIMVRPFSFRSGASYGTTPFGTAEVTRNINVRIRTGAAMMSVNPDEREPNNPHPSAGDTNPPLSRRSHSTHRATDVSSRSPFESAANNQEATVENEGAFLSNVLQQIMPFIAQNAPLRHPANAEEASMQQASASDAGTSSSQEETDPSPPRPSKRQKKE